MPRGVYPRTRRTPQPLTQEYVRSLFIYDPDSGQLWWRISRTNRFPAGTLVKGVHRGQTGYLRQYVSIDWERYLVHRIIWLYVYGTLPPDKEIDHIDGNGLNNRITNLRLAERFENCANHGRRVGRSGYRGVQFHAGGYTASIGFNGTYHYLGRFKTGEEASRAYEAARDRLHKEYASKRLKPSYPPRGR